MKRRKTLRKRVKPHPRPLSDYWGVWEFRLCDTEIFNEREQRWVLRQVFVNEADAEEGRKFQLRHRLDFSKMKVERVPKDLIDRYRKIANIVGE